MVRSYRQTQPRDVPPLLGESGLPPHPGSVVESNRKVIPGRGFFVSELGPISSTNLPSAPRWAAREIIFHKTVISCPAPAHIAFAGNRARLDRGRSPAAPEHGLGIRARRMPARLLSTALQESQRCKKLSKKIAPLGLAHRVLRAP